MRKLLLTLMLLLPGCYCLDRQYVLDELDSNRSESNEQWAEIRGMKRDIKDLQRRTVSPCADDYAVPLVYRN